MKTTIATLLMLLFCFHTGAFEQLPEDRPNILWIIADDLSPDLSCYDASAVKTPNIDRLAEQGVRYERVFATAPACSPSRTALITGVFQTTLGGHQHRTRSKPRLPEGTKLVTELFREAGYFVANGNNKLTGYGKTDYNLTLGKGVFDGYDWRQRAKGQPFFAQVQIYQPHRPFKNENDPRRAERVELPPYLADHPVIRQDWANYLADVEWLDRQVGAVLDRLEADGLAENTIVIFFADHGRPQLRSKQWLYDGGIHVPMVIRWPGKLQAGQTDDRMISLLDLAPACLAASGIPVPDTMQGRDFLVDDKTGREVIYAARDRSGDAIERVRCVRDKRYKYIRNYMPERPYHQWSSYLAVHYPAFTVMHELKERGDLGPGQAWFGLPTKPEEELYDLEQDPFEMNNLADDPSQRDRVKRMRSMVEQWTKQTNDRGAVVEGDRAYFEKLSREKVNWYRNTQKKRGLDPDISFENYRRWWADKLELQ